METKFSLKNDRSTHFTSIISMVYPSGKSWPMRAIETVTFNSRIVVENCVVGICNNGMFLEFHEFETKYLAGVYKRH